MTIDHTKFWNVLRDSPTNATIQERLESLSDLELSEIGAALIEIRSDFVDALMNSQRDERASEDILDDLAGMLLRSGQKKFQEYAQGTLSLPAREEWSRAELASVAPCIAATIKRRLNKSLFEVYDECTGEI